MILLAVNYELARNSAKQAEVLSDPLSETDIERRYFMLLRLYFNISFEILAAIYSALLQSQEKDVL